MALTKFLNKKFDQEAKKHNLNICLITAVFAKFNIDSVGNVESITYTNIKHIPEVFETIITSVIKSTNGQWIPRKINGKSVKSKPFILPVIYAMEAGCNPQKVQQNNSYNEVYNGIETSLLYILNYEDDKDNNVGQIDCILLRPLHAFSQN